MKLPASRTSTANKFVTSRRTLDAFHETLLKHIRALYDKGELNPHCFAHALVEFGKEPNVTESDLLGEINIMFIAGEKPSQSV